MAIKTTSQKNLFFVFLFLFATPCSLYLQDEELELDETEELSLDDEPELSLDEETKPALEEETTPEEPTVTKEALPEEKIEPGEEAEEEPGEEDGEEEEEDTDDEPLPDSPLDKLLEKLGDKVSGLLTNFLSKLTGKAKESNSLEQLHEDLKQGIIRIPKIGLLKFSSPDEAKITLPKGEEISDLKFVGTLYDSTGKTIKSINAGPFKLNKFHILLSSSSKIPRLFLDATFFNYRTIIFQKITESIDDLHLSLSFPDKPFKIGVGPINATISYFDLLLSEDEKTLSTDVKLSKFPGMTPIKFDITDRTFTINATDIRLVDLVKKVIPPFKKLTFPTLIITITLPGTLEFAGVADLSKVKMGLNTKGTKGTVSGSLGTDGINFNLEIENVHLPFNRGTINKATIQLNTE
ncbi:hypothetical protein KAT92_03470 [Candidatus Babeliales bacterium]|nr:hypothetical protein [Candidatus Babeliales bacterium]